MNQRQADRLVKLASFLKRLKNDKWDYSAFERLKSVDVCATVSSVENKVRKVECGTVGCALGWCTNVFPHKFKSGFAEKISEAIDEGSVESLEALIDDSNFDLQVKHQGEWIDSSEHTDNHLYSDRFCQAIGEFFGLSNNEVEHLFLGVNTLQTYGVEHVYDVTKNMVVKKIYDVMSKHGYKV